MVTRWIFESSACISRFESHSRFSFGKRRNFCAQSRSCTHSDFIYSDRTASCAGKTQTKCKAIRTRTRSLIPRRFEGGTSGISALSRFVWVTVFILLSARSSLLFACNARLCNNEAKIMKIRRIMLNVGSGSLIGMHLLFHTKELLLLTASWSFLNFQFVFIQIRLP